MKTFFALALLSWCLSSCTTLPRPVATESSSSDAEAVRLLRESSKQAGDPWQRLGQVEVSYDGEWSQFAETTQPVLVDAAYRKTSIETYTPSLRKVVQVHRGQAGEKFVVRTPTTILINRNGDAVENEEELRAAALVADGYTLFTFGSSVLRELGSGWQIAGQRRLKGERCSLLSGTLRPGIGKSEADQVIAWIGQDSKRLLRLQFTLNGMPSTAGADVDVTFSDFQAGPNDTEWPRHFVERIRRPVDLKAHEWRMTALRVEP